MVKSHESSRHLVIDDFCDYLCVKKNLNSSISFYSHYCWCWELLSCKLSHKLKSDVHNWFITFVTLFKWRDSCKFEVSRTLNNGSNAAAKLCIVLTLSGNTTKTLLFLPPPPSNVFMRDKGRIIYLEMGGGMGEGWEVYWKWRGLTKHAVKIDGKRQWARQWAWYSLYA